MHSSDKENVKYLGFSNFMRGQLSCRYSVSANSLARDVRHVKREFRESLKLWQESTYIIIQQLKRQLVTAINNVRWFYVGR